MAKEKIRVYLASGWFSPRTRDIRDNLEKLLDSRIDVSLYSPLRDGIMLPPNQKHDTALRESIFKENIQHILEADLVVANIDSVDPYNDPGTIYEIGYAMAHSIPVLGFCMSINNIQERFRGILSGFDSCACGYNDLIQYLDNFMKLPNIPAEGKVLFVGAGDEIVDNKIASCIAESGASLRWVNDMHEEVYSRIDEIFQGVKYMIAIIDDRKTIVSWMIGQAYARNIPVVTYSDFNWGINVMLLVSVLTHIRGTEELSRFLQQVKREGLESIPEFDISELDSM